MKLTLKDYFFISKCFVISAVLGQVLSIYVPNEIDQSPKTYTTGIKIKTSQYRALAEPYYNSNYSKVYIHNKNYTSSLLDSASNSTKSTSYVKSTNTKLYPVYMSEAKKEKIENVIKEHNTNVVEKDTLNNRVVYKRRIEKDKNIEVYNRCPPGVTGQFVYDASCNQFLDCWNGRGSPRNCAPGTLFNPKTLECDFPEKVQCLTGPSASSLTLQRSAKLQNYEQAKCPEGFSGLIPNYTDCTTFIQCNSGIETPGTCPPGTLFDISLNVCNHPDQTTCYSGQLGTSYVIKEQSGGSGDVTERYHSQIGQYQGQTGHRGQYGQFFGQNNYLEQVGQSHDDTEYHQTEGHHQGTVVCDPTSPYCHSGGYIVSGQKIYRNPRILTSGNKAYGQSGTTSHFGHDSQFLGGGAGACNPQTQNCLPGAVTSYSQASPGQETSQDSRGTVYIQYVMCNTAEEDCSNFQQGTYIFGPGGTLCNPVKQNCNVSPQYVPSTKMYDQANANTVRPSGVYYVKYILCNPVQEDCSKYHRGVMEATYGVPAGTQSLAGTSQGTGFSQIPAECNPQLHKCDNVLYHSQRRPQVPSYGSTSSGQGQLGQACNPQYQSCGQYTGRGHGFSQTDFQSQYSNNSFNGSTNYKRVCSAGDENCYRGEFSTSTTTHNARKDRDGEPKCPEGFQGITKHPTSCKKFLNCANGITYVQDCAPGTLFNPYLRTCDFSYNVDCKGDDQEESTTVNYPYVYDQNQVHTSQFNQTCQGSQCIQGQKYGGRTQGHITNTYGQTGCQGYQCHQGQFVQDQVAQGQIGQGATGCQGSQCRQGQFGQGQVVQSHFGQGITGCPGTQCRQGQFGQDQVTQVQFGQGITGCQGSQCRQGQFGQDQVTQVQFGQGITGCQGSQCHQGQFGQVQEEQSQFEEEPVDCQGCNQNQFGGRQPGQTQDNGIYDENQGQTGGAVSINPNQSCQGNQCFTQVYQGYTTPPPQGQGSIQSSTGCQGYQCRFSKGQTFQNQYPASQTNLASTTTTQRTNLWPPQGSRRPDQSNQGYGSQGVISQGHAGQDNDQSNVMKIPPRNTYQQISPKNKLDRTTSGGFNNQKSIDYVDIFNPEESRNFVYATTSPKTTQKPEKQVWPPPYSDFVTTDPNADYVFEYEDGEPVTLAPEKVNIEKKIKTRCGSNDFVCDKKSCVAKSFVCDGVRDCADGKDEKYCQKYLDEFKQYENSRLDVLEKQRWDNVSYSTCALLCMDSQKFECKSFNYRKVDRACFLTNENIGTSGALNIYHPCDYYERKSMSLDCTDMHKCPNGKCLKSEDICDGYDDCGDRADERECRAADFGYKVKLAGGQEENEGRIEVTVFGKTGYICDDKFSIIDANVACKELGFFLGAAEVKGNSYYAKDLEENHTLYMMDDIKCIGNESSLMHCHFAGWGIHNCADREIVGVVCKTPEETCSEGFWKCDTGNECVKLPFLCDGLDDCTDNSDEASRHCDAPIDFRLVNGSKPNEGRLEVRHLEVWGSICDDDFNDDAAKIVCRYLGYYGSAYVKKEAYFGESSGPIWLDQVSCYGNESSIDKCSHWEWGTHNCDHSEDVGIVCSNEMVDVDAQRSSKAVGGGVSGSIKPLGASASSPEPVTCGYRKDNIFLENDDVHVRVVQGSLAKPGDYPWQAALRINDHDKTAHWCGAVVIASKWVLTAAHCLEGYPKGSYVVVAGEYSIDEDEGTEQQAFIEEYYLHESFRKGHKMANDIAMIKLKRNGFRLNQDIQPICLPDETSNYERELNCTISGFGTIKTGKSVYSHKLRAAWIPIQKMDVCKMAHIYGEAIGDGMICAGDLSGGVDACDGDSGGPLACLQDGVFTLYGLTSWGQRCGYANKPGVYVKVSYYKKWIENIMKIHP